MSTVDRIDRAERVIDADPAAIYAALTDAAALATWLPPLRMSGWIEAFDPRPGGGFRMVLSYPPDVLANGEGPGPGKTTDLHDVVQVTFTVLEPGAKVEWQATFDAADPAFAGIMTQTWILTPLAAQRTKVVIEARGVPQGISPHDHEMGLNASPAQLAAWVTRPQAT